MQESSSIWSTFLSQCFYKPWLKQQRIFWYRNNDYQLEMYKLVISFLITMLLVMKNLSSWQYCHLWVSCDQGQDKERTGCGAWPEQCDMSTPGEMQTSSHSVLLRCSYWQSTLDQVLWLYQWYSCCESISDGWWCVWVKVWLCSTDSNPYLPLCPVCQQGTGFRDLYPV